MINSVFVTYILSFLPFIQPFPFTSDLQPIVFFFALLSIYLKRFVRISSSLLIVLILCFCYTAFSGNVLLQDNFNSPVIKQLASLALAFLIFSFFKTFKPITNPLVVIIPSCLYFTSFILLLYLLLYICLFKTYLLMVLILVLTLSLRSPGLLSTEPSFYWCLFNFSYSLFSLDSREKPL